MHISDGLLPGSVCLGGYVVTAGLTAWSLRQVSDRDVPRLAIMTSTFFAASLIHLRLGVTSVHLLLHGLVGAVVGPAAFIPIVVGLILQALLFGHGGVTTIGINALVLGLPAMASGWFVRRFGVRQVRFGDRPAGSARRNAPGSLPDLEAATRANKLLRTVPASIAAPRIGLIAFLAGAGAMLASLALFLLVGLTADPAFFTAIGLFLAGHVPLAVLEGAVTSAAVGFLAKVKPEVFHRETLDPLDATVDADLS
jgi:cobalt/nickel transport system permease protein